MKEKPCLHGYSMFLLSTFLTFLPQMLFDDITDHTQMQPQSSTCSILLIAWCLLQLINLFSFDLECIFAWTKHSLKYQYQCLHIRHIASLHQRPSSVCITGQMSVLHFWPHFILIKRRSLMLLNMSVFSYSAQHKRITMPCFTANIIELLTHQWQKDKKKQKKVDVMFCIIMQRDTFLE